MTSDKPPSHLFSPYLTDYSSPSTSLISTNTGSNAGKGVSRRRDEFWLEDSRGLYRPVTIGALPDDALLEIFSFYVENAYQFADYFDLFYTEVRPVEAWSILTHVCQRWRGVVFASPQRLNLRILCRSTRPVSEMQEIWPTLPIFVEHWHGTQTSGHEPSLDENVIAALEHTDRICEIRLLIKSHSLYHRYSTILQERFLALQKLNLCFNSDVESAAALPDSFLGGSAPRLRSLFLRNIPFPALPKLLLSTTDLVFLQVLEIPHSGYISPEAMVTCLSFLTRLEHVFLSFESPRSRPARPSRRLSSLTRVDLPALTRFEFRGVNDYIEDLVARITAPLLVDIRVLLFNQLLFDISQLTQFIDRGEFKVHHHAAVVFHDHFAWVGFFPTEGMDDRTGPRFLISSTQSEWQLSSLAEVCSSFSSHLRLSSLERLDILTFQGPEHWHDDMENIQWLELLQPYTAVKHLYLDNVLALRLPRALQELTEELSTEVLPALQTISIEVEEDQLSGGVKEAIRPFIAARQRSGNPVAVQSWQPDRDIYEWF